MRFVHKKANFEYTKERQYIDINNNFYICKRIGSGDSAHVYSGNQTGFLGRKRICAYKIQPLVNRVNADCDWVQVNEPEEEFRLHSKVNGHPHVVELIGRFTMDPGPFKYIILELCHHDGLTLSHYIESRCKQFRLGSSERNEGLPAVLNQILDAVEYCHERGVFHCDIKPDNILICAGTRRVKLADFGMASDRKRIFDRRGSEGYISPEALAASSEKPFWGDTADIWSIGVTMVTCLAGLYLWSYPNDQDFLYKIYLSTEDKESHLCECLEVSVTISCLLNRIFDRNPDARPSIAEIRRIIMSFDAFKLESNQQSLLPAFSP